MIGARISRWTVLLLLVCTLAIGCGRKSDNLQTGYGKRTGNQAGSVNGTKALSEMFRDAGYYVRSYGVVSPSLLRHDVIVWFPDSFDGPTPEFRDTILNWLNEEEGRTFIYVGRDFDASIEYWGDVLNKVDPTQKFDVMRQRSLAIESFDKLRNYQSPEVNYTLYKIERDVPRRIASSLTGPWAKGIDAAKTKIELRSRMIPPDEDSIYEGFNTYDEDAAPIHLVEDTEILLGTGKEAIVARLGSDYSDNQIILVNNGSFLLNLPLVNPEHRKLAAKLVNQCDPAYYAPDSVAFLETEGGVRIMNADQSTDGNSGWEWLSKWPLNLVGLQMAWWLIVLCFALYPIFGRAKRLPSAETSDFKKHIDSVGDLLQATDDHGYAQLRIQQYHQVMKGDTVYRRSKVRRGEGK
ncbi:hypothetical protein C5Y96_07870 [Blastopirellula marina]|uniref:DUF4350 domain-containing protein n=1 Tax=Blastopirellula marina TaxID=124 RepID=A0A2S8FY08_9BACT|nr:MULTISPECIES: DUF4350 domain-containing protein [Pirellulaceae]PQO37067.1 hypothetical protein C5Y96_07870 [Blastopirellula marina]RCS53782.1 hypothetical protein DTL36_07880 [Bremerella cremea]